MNLTKCGLITDVVERRQYDFLEKTCRDILDSKDSTPSVLASCRLMVFRTWEGHNRVSLLDAPPPELNVDPALISWPSLRQKYAGAAEAYKEMLDQFDGRSAARR